MRKTRITISLFIALCSSLASYSQSWPSSLLWRISGNGLQQPSYLYGTMHLTDRRLFFFSDSLYKALEESQGFAMEIDPAEMMDSVFSRMSDDKSPLLKEIMHEREYSKVEKKLEKKLGLPADKITRKTLADARRRSIYKSRKPDDMKTAVDLYLYDLAQRMGKHIGGIEDVSDQMDMLDEMGGNVDINQLVKDIDDEESVEKYKERMITMYVKEDIERINEMVSPAASDFLSLIKRNIKMARRMDSLARIRNSFFAVGAAHLPGDSGVISLLRQKGFTVVPVNSVNKIAPEKYSVAKKKTNWQQVVGNDSAYTIEMPGKPSDMNMFSDELKFKVYVDMADPNKVFMSCAVFIPEGDSAAVYERMQKSFSGKGFDKVEEKTIMHLGISGKEVTSFREKLYYRMQFFSTSNKIYMLFNAAPEKEKLYGEEPEHFFQSFKPNLALEAKIKNWNENTDTLKAFTITMPGKVKVVSNITPEGSEGHTQTNSYTSFDMKNTAYYMVVVSETKKGYYINDDSLIFNAQLENYASKDFTISDKRYFEMNGYPAISFAASGEKDGTEIVTKMLIVSRGNRNYTVAAITEKGKEDFPNITKFFRSFSLLPYKPSSFWLLQQAPNKTYSTWSPSVIDTIENKGDDAGLASKEIQYAAFDAASVDNYYISVEPLSKYYHTDSDSTFLAEDIVRYYTDTSSYLAKQNPGNFDSLVSIKKIINGKTNGLEILVKNAAKSHYKRLRLLRNADSSYVLYVMAPYSTLYNENANRFFEDFSFVNEAAPTTIFTNKTNLLLNDLQSADSATLADAKTALVNMKFSGTDISLLYQAFLKDYPADSTEYYSIASRLADKIEDADSVATIQFVKENYHLQTGANEKKMLMLCMLSSLRKTEAVALLKELILTKPLPTTFPGRLFGNLTDSLLLAKQLFPESTVLFGDTVLGPGFISIAVNLVDSSFADKKLLTDNKSSVFAMANRQLKEINQPDEGYFAWGADIIRALEIIGDADAVKILYQLVAVKDPETKKDALLALIKLNKPAPAAEIRKLVTDKYYRIEFYRLLKSENKTALYPKEFLTQQKFAEGYIAMAASEDDMDSENISCIFIGEKTVSFKGVLSRFYIYKMLVKYDEEKYEYPAISGPFDMDKTKVQIKEDEDWTRIYYDEKVPAATATGKLFSQYQKDLPAKDEKK